MVEFRRATVVSRALARKSSLLVAVVCVTAALSACGGGEEETAAVQNPPVNPPVNPPAGNSAPTISGTPATQTTQGQLYSFTPSANDANSGDTLTFSITNKPDWAAFTASTGQLSGTPSSAQVGNYADIQISVSDGTATANLAAFSISVVGTTTGSATLSWNPPTQNTDGSALTNLAGYKVYWGTSPGNYPNSTPIGAGLSSYVVDQLAPATWYFALTAVNASGAESTYSNIATKQVL